MGIEEILEKMDDLIDKSMQIPLSGGKCVVSADKLRDFIDDIRLNMPMEIKQARAIVADRTEIIANARKESDAIIAKAEDKARAIVSESAIVKQSEARSNEILQAASQKSKELRTAATDFAENVFKVAEDMLVSSLGEVKKARQSVRGTRNEQQ
ncbi:MAG: ATPase [Oscillospiraceae bacterium]|nr:ATPase [Oscillospiraceae bacterium]